MNDYDPGMADFVPSIPGEVKPIQPNRLGMMLANTIRAGRSALNYPGKLPESVPMLGGMGLGDLAFGQGPELAEEMAHGFPPYKGTGYGTVVDPRVIDLAGTPTLGAPALVKGTALGGQKIMSKLIKEGAPDLGRREFLKEAGKAGVVGATGATVGSKMAKLLRSVGKESIPTAISAAARAGALTGAVKGWAYNPGAIHHLSREIHVSMDPSIVKANMDELLANQHFAKSVQKFVEQNPEVTDDFLERLITGKHPGNPDYTDEAQGVAHEWLFPDQESMVPNPERLKMMEEYFITGKMAKGMPPEVANYDPWEWLPESNRFDEISHPLGETLYDRKNVEVLTPEETRLAEEYLAKRKGGFITPNDLTSEETRLADEFGKSKLQP